MQRDEEDNNCSEWSQMSDYDGMGVAPTIGSSRQHDHHEDSSIRMAYAYDETDDACRCEWKSGPPNDECYSDMVWTTNNTTKGEMYHVIIRDEVKPEEELKVVTTIAEEPTQTQDVQTNPDNQAQQHNHEREREIHDEVETKEIWNHDGLVSCVRVANEQ